MPVVGVLAPGQAVRGRAPKTAVGWCAFGRALLTVVPRCRETTMPTEELGTTAALPTPASRTPSATPRTRPSVGRRARAHGFPADAPGVVMDGTRADPAVRRTVPAEDLRPRHARPVPVDTVAGLAVTRWADPRHGAGPSTVPRDEVWIARLAGLGHQRG